jgi:AhpD family alkylhydroperoxidase
MTDRLEQFRIYREQMNARILEKGTTTTRRFFNLDSRCYDGGALPGLTKELLGLVASLVLRCDDCVSYHLIRCVQLGASDQEITEALDVGLVVGGSIVIPHLRRARELLDQLAAAGPDAAQV